MKTKLALGLAVLLSIGGVAILVAQTNTQSASEQLSQEEALALVRNIVTAETELALRKQPFASLAELLQTRFFQSDGSLRFTTKKPYQSEITLTDSNSGTLKNYRLSVIASADGQHFQVRLAPEQGCDTGLFSNESAVIYKGKGLGCPAQ